MNPNELKEKINSIELNFNVDKTTTLVNELNEYIFDNNSQSEEYIIQYTRIGDILLKNSVNVKSYNLDDFKNKFSEKVSVKEIIEQNKDDFDELLNNFIEKEKSVLTNLKGFFIFKIEIGDPIKTDLLFLHDEHCKSEPHIRKFKSDFPEIEINSVNDFNSDSYNDKRILVILYIPEIISSENDTFKKIEEIIKKFGGVVYHELDNNFQIKIQNKDVLLYQIMNYCRCIFNNVEFNQEEEILIKSLFSKDCSILNYKKLRSGFSGAKVIEVQALKPGGDSIRKVIKIDTINSGKITKEASLFKAHIEDYGVLGYTHYHEKTSGLEAISYNYASSDGYLDSHSLSELIIGNHKNDPDIIDILKNIFNCKLLKTWKEKNIFEEVKSVEDIYEEYTDSNQIFKIIKKIENKNDDDLELIINARTILKTSIKYKVKICHGDFHSQNIFIDTSASSHVTLIDFGWTDFRHSVIDHTFLECSIKYNHIPKYIPVDELLKIEERLFNLESFKPDFDLSFIERRELKTIYEWILEIRRDALQFFVDSNRPMEYFISLFIISLRMIVFRDLNQLFALKLSEQLASFILNTI
jgi:hypothetical protein